MFWYYYTIAELGDTNRNLPDGIGSSIYFHLANPSLRSGMVCLIASLAYLTMASGNGWFTRCHDGDGRQFFYARYIYWIVTTPLMLHAIAHFANSPDEIWNFLMFSDIIMIAAGPIASTNRRDRKVTKAAAHGGVKCPALARRDSMKVCLCISVLACLCYFAHCQQNKTHGWILQPPKSGKNKFLKINSLFPYLTHFIILFTFYFTSKNYQNFENPGKIDK